MHVDWRLKEWPCDDTARNCGRLGFVSCKREIAMKLRCMGLRFRTRSLQRSVVCALFGLAMLGGAESQGAPLQVRKISAEVMKLEGPKLTVRTAAGSVLDVELADHFRLTARSAAAPTVLKPGAFVGTTAVAQPDGTLLAREVHVFPESMRGNGEGHRPMDTEPGSTMTNATIASIGELDAPSLAINKASVALMSASAHQRRLTLRYPGGEKVVLVPDNVPIVMVEPADRSLLAPGAHVVVFATTKSDGSLLAERVTVGKNGFVPPS